MSAGFGKHTITDLEARQLVVAAYNAFLELQLVNKVLPVAPKKSSVLFNFFKPKLPAGGGTPPATQVKRPGKD
jgi:hypothetical protein